MIEKLLGSNNVGLLPVEHLDELFALARQLIENSTIYDGWTDGSSVLVEGLSRKLYRHCWTIREISRIQETFADIGGQRAPDYASMAVLQRAAMENFKVLFEVYLELEFKSDIAQHRRLTYLAKGMDASNAGEKYLPEIYTALTATQPEMEIPLTDAITALNETILASPSFELLSNETKNKLPEQLRKARLSYESIVDHNRDESHEAMGMEVNIAKVVMAQLNAQVHSDAFSAFTDPGQPTKYGNGPLQMVGVLLAKLVCAFAQRVEQCRQICMRKDNVEIYALAHAIGKATWTLNLDNAP